MNTVVVTADVISTVAFVIAGLMALLAPFDSPLVTKSVRVVFVGAMSLYAFVGVSNVLEHAGITAFFDLYEDFAEILFVPALAYVASTMYQNQQIDSQQKAARVMRQQNDLLLNIVDTVPGGILVVGPTGAVTFANEGAERLLGMTSDSGGSVSITPSWTLLDPSHGRGDDACADRLRGNALAHPTCCPVARWHADRVGVQLDAHVGPRRRTGRQHRRV